MTSPRCGEIYLASFDPTIGHRARLQKRVGAIDAATMGRVDDAIKISLGLVPL